MPHTIMFANCVGHKWEVLSVSLMFSFSCERQECLTWDVFPTMLSSLMNGPQEDEHESNPKGEA